MHLRLIVVAAGIVDGWTVRCNVKKNHIVSFWFEKLGLYTIHIGTTLNSTFGIERIDSSVMNHQYFQHCMIQLVSTRCTEILPTRFDLYQLYFLSFWFGETWMGLWKRSSVWGNDNISNIYSSKCDNYGFYMHHAFYWGAKNKAMFIYVN